MASMKLKKTIKDLVDTTTDKDPNDARLIAISILLLAQAVVQAEESHMQ